MILRQDTPDDSQGPGDAQGTQDTRPGGPGSRQGLSFHPADR